MDIALLFLLLISVIVLGYFFNIFSKNQIKHNQKVEKLLAEIRDAFWDSE